MLSTQAGGLWRGESSNSLSVVMVGGERGQSQAAKENVAQKLSDIEWDETRGTKANPVWLI